MSRGLAMVFDGPGRPLRRVEFDPPLPAAGEVLVHVTDCTLCGSDLHTFAGRRSAPTPSTLGHEILGRVESLPPGGSTAWDGRPLAIGDRVVWAVAVGCGNCFFCTHDLPQKCERLLKYGHEPFAVPRDLRGGLATHTLLAPGTPIFCVPDILPDAVACPAGCATATAAAVLRHGGEVADCVVMIFGAGLLGLTVAAMARAKAARAVLVVDPVASRLDLARRFGATHVAGPAAGLDTLLAELTDGRGADVAIDVSGAAAAPGMALERARVGGRCLWVGSVLPTPAVALAPEMVVRRQLTIQGVHNYHPRDLATALNFLAGPGRDYPFAELVGEPMPLEAAEAGFAAAARSGAIRVRFTPNRGPASINPAH